MDPNDILTPPLQLLYFVVIIVVIFVSFISPLLSDLFSQNLRRSQCAFNTVSFIYVCNLWGIFHHSILQTVFHTEGHSNIPKPSLLFTINDRCCEGLYRHFYCRCKFEHSFTNIIPPFFVSLRNFIIHLC
jgi:hypothetical protein